jgi:hypothetical protein
MTAAKRKTPNEVHPLDLLLERTRALAKRVQAGELKFIEAVDFAYTAADFTGLIDRFGDDAVQTVLAAGFSGRKEESL